MKLKLISTTFEIYGVVESYLYAEQTCKRWELTTDVDESTSYVGELVIGETTQAEWCATLITLYR